MAGMYMYIILLMYYASQMDLRNTLSGVLYIYILVHSNTCGIHCALYYVEYMACVCVVFCSQLSVSTCPCTSVHVHVYTHTIRLGVVAIAIALLFTILSY